METSEELHRLKNVYVAYRERALGKAKWSSNCLGNRAMQHELRQVLDQLLDSAGLKPLGERRILDIGCGGGERLHDFQQWGAQPENLFGIDLLPDAIQVARRKFPGLNFQPANGEAVPFGDESFDLVSTFVVFSSVLSDQMTRNISREINRLLRPGGALVWYDLRLPNPMNPNVRCIRRRQLRHLFSGFRVVLRSVTVLPPLARSLGVWTSMLYPALASIRLLRTHYAGLLIKP